MYAASQTLPSSSPIPDCVLGRAELSQPGWIRSWTCSAAYPGWGGIAPNRARPWAFSFIASISGLCSACLLWQQEKLEMSKGRVNKLCWHKFQ